MITGITFALYVIATVALSGYLYSISKRPVGASFFFLLFVFLFHAVAFPFYVEIWSAKLEFGLLSQLAERRGDLVTQVTVAMSLSYLGIVLGCLVGDWWWRLKHREGDHPFPASGNGELQRLSIVRLLNLAFCLEVVMVVMLLYQYSIVTNPSALYAYYLSDLSSAERVDVRRAGGVGFYPYSILQLTVIPFVAFVMLAEALRRRSPYLTYRLARFCFFLLLVKLSTFSKAGPALLLIQLWLCFELTRARSLNIQWHYVRVGVLALCVIFAFVYFVRDELVPLEAAVLSLFYRLLMIPNEVIFEYFNAIPSYFPHGYGLGISWLTSIFGDVGGTGLNLPTHVLVASVYRGDYGTVVNSFFVAEAWAQFAWPGVVIGSLLAGFLVKWYDYRAAIIQHNSVRLALVVSSVSGAHTLATSAVTTALLTGGLLIIPLVAWWVDRGKMPQLIALSESHKGLVG